MNKIIRRMAIFFSIIIGAENTSAQVLNCQVQVVHQKVTGANEELFKKMQRDIYDFLNNRHWTEHIFAQNEKIECSFLINIVKQNSSDQFEATLQVTSRRPVYNSSYNTSMLNFKEKESNFIFKYSEGLPLEFNLNVFSSLTSTLAFYAYIIIGIDYDSFGMLGGTEYFQNALKIANLGQSAGERGWLPYEDQKENNRYWLADAFTNDVYEDLRRINYLYHRLGLDQMADNLTSGRRVISESLQTMKKSYTRRPNALIYKLFFTNKSEELIQIFKESQPTEKTLAYNTLVEMDIANQSKYEVLKNAN